MSTPTRLLAVGFALIGLTACIGGEVASTPTATPTSDETVSASVSPTATVEASPDPLAACADAQTEGTTLQIPVETVSFAFDTRRIEGPRHCQPFAIVFTNHDVARPQQGNAKHDIDIRAGNVLGPVLFDGSLAGQGTRRFEVPGLPAGEHYFYCSVPGAQHERDAGGSVWPVTELRHHGFSRSADHR